MDSHNCKNLAEYVIKNHAETISSSLIRYFRDNNLYAYKEEYDEPEKHSFSIELYLENYGHAYFKAPGNIVDFDLQLDFVIETTNLVGDEIKTSIFSDTYTLSIEAELNKGLHNLVVKRIVYGAHLREFNFSESLSVFLTPYIKTMDYEKYAHEFLEIYYPEALVKPTFVNPKVLLERMGLSIYFAKLADGIDGKIIFADEKALVFDSSTKTIKEIVVSEGTILINISIIEKGRGCLNNTIVHECLHWWLHKKYFELQMLLNPNDISTKSFIDEMDMPDRKKFENKYYMELQARSISPIVLMPKETASIYYETVLSNLESRKSYHSKTKTFLQALYMFAEQFGASISCAKIRLENLGYTEVSFSTKRGNDLNIRPFKSSVRLETGQTYILEFKDAVKAFSKHDKARLALLSGKILYVDGLFVVNDEKYVKFYKKSIPRLTELALSDVSKCCILFDTKKEGYSVEFDPEKFNFATFCSGGSKTKYNNNPTVSSSESNKDLLDLKRSSLRHRDETVEARAFVSEMNKYTTFAGKFNCLVGDRCMAFISNRGIASKCMMDSKTIKAYREGPSRPDEKKLLAICAGLQLHPLVSGYLLAANRMNIYNIAEEPYPFYFYLLNTCYNTNLETWNILIRENFPDHPEYLL